MTSGLTSFSGSTNILRPTGSDRSPRRRSQLGNTTAGRGTGADLLDCRRRSCRGARSGTTTLRPGWGFDFNYATGSPPTTGCNCSISCIALCPTSATKWFSTAAVTLSP